ncbi:Lsr2 family protein [Arthrobacter liuii]|uniref:Lsr2 family protein n=1 Tax=Arthrobacter liuii TaxID=1476996 RepID=A0ABQ2AWP9_9MICC|nr:Lsr2 family protein [Arthrobacter liuii]GGI00363.1 Lsr2 family protein [Arthrobacter liuii]
MASRTVIELVDDLDGSEATETVRFALDGSDYEIDLADRNTDLLRSLLARFVDASRKTSGTRQTPRAHRLAASADTKAVRAWAAEKGIEVNARGRVREDVVKRYLASFG